MRAPRPASADARRYGGKARARTAKAKVKPRRAAPKKGLLINVTGLMWMPSLCSLTTRGGNNACVCAAWLVKAGMSPILPGESRRVRVTVKDA